MEEELLPLSDAKTRLHELLRSAEQRDVVLLRHGRPIGALLGYRRYRHLRQLELGGGDTTTQRGAAAELRALADDVNAICRRRRVRRLALFGSAARGEEGPSSDVDLIVEFSPMTPAEHADAYFGLHEDLERLLGRTVDLVEESAVRNPYIRDAIESERTTVYDSA